MPTIKQLLKSKTLRMSILIAMLGALELNIEVIPYQYQGYTLIVISGVMVVLRFLTTMPLDEK